MNVTDDELKLAHEESRAEDQQRVWANRHRSKREGFTCWAGPNCPHCNPTTNPF